MVTARVKDRNQEGRGEGGGGEGKSKEANECGFLE